MTKPNTVQVFDGDGHPPRPAPILGPRVSPMRREEALGLAAQAWCTEENKGTEMDSRLASAFADILMEQALKASEPVEVKKAKRTKAGTVIKEARSILDELLSP